MNKSAILLMAFAIVGLSACSKPRPKYEYVKYGGTLEQRVDALAGCEYQIKLNKTAKEQQSELLNLCMYGQGYRWRQVGTY